MREEGRGRADETEERPSGEGIRAEQGREVRVRWRWTVLLHWRVPAIPTECVCTIALSALHRVDSSSACRVYWYCQNIPRRVLLL